MTITSITWRWCLLLILVNIVVGASLDRGKRAEVPAASNDQVTPGE